MADPIYYLEIEDGDGLTQVSLVQSPAIEEDFHFFSADKFVTPTANETEQEFISRCIPVLIGEGKDQEQAAAICYTYWQDKTQQSFAIQSEERRIITGPAMIAEKPILRRGEDGSTYYVKFSAATIQKAVKLWALQNKYNAVNAEHANPVGGMHLLESFIVDKERGINPPQMWAGAPEGSWFLSYYVEDDAVWASIKEGKFKGFSIEGYFTDKPATSEEQTMAAITAILTKYDNSENQTLDEMSALNKINEIKKLLGFSVEEEEPAVKLGETTLVDGTVVRFPGESLEVGAVLEVQTPDGEYAPAPDGTHETADGYLVTTEGGVVTDIQEKAAEVAPVEQGEDFASVKAEFEAKFNEQSALIARLTGLVENLTNAQAKTLEVIEQFSAIPAAEPAKKVNALKGEAARRDERIMAFAEAIRKIKTQK